jgi:hypothetical protein
MVTTVDDTELVLTDPPTGKINTTCIQRVQQPIGESCYHNLTQHQYDFLVQGEVCVGIITYTYQGYCQAFRVNDVVTCNSGARVFRMPADDACICVVSFYYSDLTKATYILNLLSKPPLNKNDK